MSDTATPAHNWLKPRLERLLDEAATHDIPRDVALAVMTDIVTSAGFGGGHLAKDMDA